jgi:hypothetical protein
MQAGWTPEQMLQRLETAAQELAGGETAGARGTLSELIEILRPAEESELNP